MIGGRTVTLLITLFVEIVEFSLPELMEFIGSTTQQMTKHQMVSIWGEVNTNLLKCVKCGMRQYRQSRSIQGQNTKHFGTKLTDFCEEELVVSILLS